MNRRVIVRQLAAAVTLTLAIGASGNAHAQDESSERAGTVIIAEVNNPAVPVVAGDAATIITLGLPNGASCPGDSRNDGYRFHTFLLPAGTDVGSLSYDNVRPLGSEDYLPMRTPDGSLFVHELLAPNTQAGQPGLIPIGFPLSFGGWPDPGLKAGDYTVGVACTEPSEWAVDRYWELDGTVRIERGATTASDDFAWEVVGGSTTSAGIVVEEDSSGGIAIWVALGAAAAVVVALLFVRRSRSAASQRSLEASGGRR
ncbi:MAG: hypothetical protein AAFY28_15085 [Actinomycetota bacterium]